ncbi:MAG: VWA-like domain-containing protein [Pseudomonadales bacterium]|jgi:predicted metal-dependent peptidase|nr:VWA-like domain-containing protein [Pseudomonadales bacterium]
MRSDPAPSVVQRHRGTEAVRTLVEYAPATGGLALWAHHRDVEATPGEVGYVAVNDGHTIRYGPGFDALPLSEQLAVVAHEVLHVALRHAEREAALRALLGDVDPELFNICADAIVNSSLDHLDWLSLPHGSVRLEQLLTDTLGVREPVEKSLLQWDVERLYRALDDRGTGNDERGERRTRSAQGSDPSTEAGRPTTRPDGPRAARARALGAQILRDLDAPSTDAQPEQAVELARTWSERLLRAHASDGAFSMLRALGADLPRVRTPWAQILRTQLQRGLALAPDLSWSRPSRSWLANRGRSPSGRRLPWEPGIVGVRRTPRLVVILDASGSISDDLLDRFATEIAAITRRTGTGLTLIVGDDTVRAVSHHPPGVATLPRQALQAGGGTDFTPLLQEADRHRPDLVVVLTDLEGPARHRPACPVLWAVPGQGNAPDVPFGRLLLLED